MYTNKLIIPTTGRQGEKDLINCQLVESRIDGQIFIQKAIQSPRVED